MLSEKPKIVTIFGATGQQGNSVARSLVDNKSFHVRGITRNPDSEAAKELHSIGVSVVKADGWNAEELMKAFEGSWAAFVNTNSDDPAFANPRAPSELELGKIIIDSVARAHVPHLIFSSLAPYNELSDGLNNCDPIDHMRGVNERSDKDRIAKYALSNKAFGTVSLVLAGSYLENLLDKEFGRFFGGWPFYPDSEGYLTTRAPRWGSRDEVPWVAIQSDFGDVVHGILLDPERWNGKNVPVVSEIATPDRTTAIFQQVTGQKARSVPLTNWEALETYGTHVLEGAKTMFTLLQTTNYGYFGKISTSTETAAELKKAAAAARGKDGRATQLLTVEEWFREVFQPKFIFSQGDGPFGASMVGK